MIAAATRLSVYFGDSVDSGPQPAGDALVRCFAEHRFPAAALLRGIEGFGLNRRIHAERLPDLSTDLPLLATAIGEPAAIGHALEDVEGLVSRGLVTTEDVRLVSAGDVAQAEAPGTGEHAKLTVYCTAGERGRRAPAYKEVVAALRARGAAGAIVLAGVDGFLHGRRRRAKLFSRSALGLRIVVSVGPVEPLLACVRELGSILDAPIASIEAIDVLKHDGQALMAPPATGGDGPTTWRAVSVYARRTARVDGRPLYSELTRRLREQGAAGATTVLGDWGFSSDERPHGDRLGRLASHLPTLTLTVDEPERLARVWSAIDDATSRHGVVTSSEVAEHRK